MIGLALSLLAVDTDILRSLGLPIFRRLSHVLVAEDEGDFFALKIVYQHAVALAGLAKRIGGVFGVVKWAGHGSGAQTAPAKRQPKRLPSRVKPWAKVRPLTFELPRVSALGKAPQVADLIGARLNHDCDGAK